MSWNILKSYPVLKYWNKNRQQIGVVYKIGKGLKIGLTMGQTVGRESELCLRFFNIVFLRFKCSGNLCVLCMQSFCIND